MSSASDRARLIEIVRQRSYGSGVEIRLASGRTSNFYFNMKPTMLDPEGAFLIGALAIEALAGEDVEMIGGLELGAVPLAAAVCAVSYVKGWPLPAFIVRKAAKDHGTQSLIEGLPKGETLAGRRVVVVEDVTTTGGSALKAAEAVERDGGIVALVLTIVDRQEGAAEAFEAAGRRFKALLTAADFR